MVNFKKIILLFASLILFYTSISYAEVVNKIEIKGNERISAETIAIFGDIALGKNYEDSDVSQLIKKLYD